MLIIYLTDGAIYVGGTTSHSSYRHSSKNSSKQCSFNIRGEHGNQDQLCLLIVKTPEYIGLRLYDGSCLLRSLVLVVLVHTILLKCIPGNSLKYDAKLSHKWAWPNSWESRSIPVWIGSVYVRNHQKAAQRELQYTKYMRLQTHHWQALWRPAGCKGGLGFYVPHSSMFLSHVLLRGGIVNRTKYC